MTADALDQQAFTLLAEIRRCIEDDLKKQALRKVDYLEALVRAGAVERTPDLHNAIMNLPCEVPSDLDDKSYRIGHREARHAAAELVAARGAVEPPAQEPLREKFCEAHLKEILNPGWHYNYEEGDAPKRLSADGVGGCAICKGERLEMELGMLRGARPSPPPATPQETT